MPRYKGNALYSICNIGFAEHSRCKTNLFGSIATLLLGYKIVYIDKQSTQAIKEVLGVQVRVTKGVSSVLLDVKKLLKTQYGRFGHLLTCL